MLFTALSIAFESRRQVLAAEPSELSERLLTIQSKAPAFAFFTKPELFLAGVL